MKLQNLIVLFNNLILSCLDLPDQSVECVQNFIKNLFIKEKTGVQKSKHSRHDLQWKFHILASCVDLLVWSAKDDSGLNRIVIRNKFNSSR